MANTYMLENNFVLSLLSASRKNIPFYNKVGFVDIKENETKYTINNSVLENDKEESSIVLSSLSILSRSEEEQKKLRDIHANHSKKFNGSIYRNEEYWKNWITAWDNKKRGWALAIQNQSDNELIGYFSFSKKVCDTRGVIVRIEEFVLDESIELERRKKLIFESFRLLVKSWIPKNDDNTDNKEENHTICFRSSMVLSHSLLAGMEGTSQQCDYWGWMYQFLSERSKVNEEFESNFLFFGIDAF
jgi:hypothetical protein